MLVKKLITLAGALGILACGACFLPALLDRQPPPPLIPAMQSIKTIAVVATNSSSTHYIDTDRLETAIAKEINRRHGDTKIRAQVGAATGPADATLSVNIREESATAIPGKSLGTMLWNFEPRVSATLTRADGQILWEEKEQVEKITQSIKATDDETEAWRQFSKSEWALFLILGQDHLDQIFYGRR
jgi:hypothetical protein